MGRYLQVTAHETSCIAPSAGICGKVDIGPEASVFGGAQIRGDAAQVSIGARSNIQEGACIHVDEGFPCILGEGVTVGHGAIVHGCTLEDNVMVGMGAIVMDGVVLGEGCLVGAGALVTQGKEFPPRTLLMGSPARSVRKLSQDEYEHMNLRAVSDYVEMSQEMADEGLMIHPGPDFKGQA